MNNEYWSYEHLIWINHYKNSELFGLLPKELVKIIIDIMMKNIKYQLIKEKNIQIIKKQIKTMFDTDGYNFHFQDNFRCDMDIVKDILIQTSISTKKPIEISHICCSGKGIVFDYINTKNNSEIKNKYYINYIFNDIDTNITPTDI